MGVGSIAYTQKFEHELSFPLLNYQLTNIIRFKSGLNTHYWNQFFLPNLRYTLKYKKNIVGLEHYYSYEFRNVLRPEEGKLTLLKIESYSVLVGRQFNFNKTYNLSSGLGVTYFNSYIGAYRDYYPQPYEVSICYEYNPLSLLFWSSFNVQLYKKLQLGINVRANPMFHDFKIYKFNPSGCKVQHDHDRLHLFVSQLSLGYKF